MEADTCVTEGNVTYINIDPPDLSVEGKACSMPDCTHKAHSVWSWAPGHLDGYRCVCCIRAIWQETLQNVQESLAGLPEGCDA